MEHITNISFSAYKKFAGDESIEIRPVTILVGKNSSGKSSITKLFPMLRCSLSDTSLKTAVSLSNDGVYLATSYRNLSHNGYSTGLALGVSLSNGIRIQLELTIGEKGEFYVQRYTLVNKGQKYELKLKNNQNTYSCEQLGNEYKKSDFFGFIHKALFKDLSLEVGFEVSIDYIGPLRAVPQPIIPTIVDTDYVGHDGANAYSMLCLDSKLASEVSLWFEETFGCKIEVNEPQLGTFQLMVHKPYMDKFYSNIADEGMGIGQVLPIVTRCLKPVENSLIVVEQPELHLHPAAHAEIARLFAKTSKTNKQSYVVETHSLNFLLGVRDAVVDKKIPFGIEDVIIYFIDEDETGSYLTPIYVNNDGTLTEWPRGVFNESNDILMQILKKANEQ